MDSNKVGVAARWQRGGGSRVLERGLGEGEKNNRKMEGYRESGEMEPDQGLKCVCGYVGLCLCGYVGLCVGMSVRECVT